MYRRFRQYLTSHSPAKNCWARSERTSTPDRGKARMARIPLIEDSPTEAAVMAQLLERNGHQVTTSGNAEDGIARCKRDKPDLC